MQDRMRQSDEDNVQDKVAVLIAGPTASGKSALALAVAQRIGGVVVNTDSMQVYRDLRVITARPNAAEMAEVPHLLYGHVDAAENYSVGRFLGDAGAALAAARAQGRMPIFTGGSGLRSGQQCARDSKHAAPPLSMRNSRAAIPWRQQACAPPIEPASLARSKSSRRPGVR
jgi:tRNA dimethylallyltransferase